MDGFWIRPLLPGFAPFFVAYDADAQQRFGNYDAFKAHHLNGWGDRIEYVLQIAEPDDDTVWTMGVNA